MPIQNESDLYEPIKQYLEDRGYSVKGEVRGVDLVAYHPDREPVLIELKKTFNLKLVFQGIDRLTLSDRVYLAVSASSAPGNVLNQNHKSVKKLCRRIGLGLIQVYFGPRKIRVDILVESGPYQPRKQKLKFKALHEEFTNRKGDPSVGGITRQKIMTVYRQQVVEVAACLVEHGDYSLAEIRESTGVKKTSSILQKNHYGWFERVARGRYRLTDLGKEEFESLVAESVE